VASVKHTKHSGIPSTSKTEENVDLGKEFVLKNRRITICKVAEHVAYFIWVSLQQFERQCERVSECHQNHLLTLLCP